MNSHYQTALLFIKKKHHGQYRAGRVPVWHHLVHVSQVLDLLLKKYKEGALTERAIIVCAALGHDILEDTNATTEETQRIFSDRGLSLIKGMTNQWGDRYKKSYIKQMIKSEEDVRIIKLADLYDNITSALYNFDRLGIIWMTSYFLPIVTPMRKAIAKTKFTKYPKTSAALLSAIEIAATLLDEEVQINKKR